MTESRNSLGDAATFINGYAFKPSDWDSTGKEIIRIQNLTNSSDSINYFDGVLPAKYKVKKGDLLISWSATLGIYEWNKEDAWLNQHIFKVVFDKFEFDKRFFFHLISFNLGKLENEVHGSTMKHITKGRFDSIRIPLPPLSTQKKIAAILDKADELRKNDKKILEKYDQLAQSVFLEMFGDPVRNEKKWDCHKGDQLSMRITVGVVVKPASFYVSKGIPALRSQNVKPNYFDLNNLVYFSQEVNDKVLNKSKLELNDVVIVRTGQPGTSAFIKKEQAGYNCIDLIIFRPNLKKVHPEYLCRFFNSVGGKNIVLGSQKGQIQKHFNIGEVKKCSIPVPPMEKQLEFVKIIQSIEMQKQISNMSLKKSEDLFQSLLQRAFRGELR